MNILNRSRGAFSVCFAAITLGGCGASGQFSTPSGDSPQGNTNSAQLRSPSRAFSDGIGFDTLSREHLIGRAVVKCGLGDTTAFSASGTATGPYPGTFSANGQYHVRRGGGAAFVEAFTIYSGVQVSGQIYGDYPNPPVFPCPTFGPIVFPYMSNYGSGKAKITILSRHHAFRERLSGL